MGKIRPVPWNFLEQSSTVLKFIVQGWRLPLWIHICILWYKRLSYIRLLFLSCIPFSIKISTFFILIDINNTTKWSNRLFPATFFMFRSINFRSIAPLITHQTTVKNPRIEFKSFCHKIPKFMCGWIEPLWLCFWLPGQVSFTGVTDTKLF